MNRIKKIIAKCSIIKNYKMIDGCFASSSKYLLGTVTDSLVNKVAEECDLTKDEIKDLILDEMELRYVEAGSLWVIEFPCIPASVKC